MLLARFAPRLGLPEISAALRPTSGQDLRRFEAAFAELAGQAEAVAFPYGRTALLLLLKALGIADLEVLCPAYTCVVVAHAIVHSGNEPVFVDSQGHDFNMDLELAERMVTKRTAAMVATSLFGYPVDLDRLASFHRRHPQVVIIQDCAHALGATWRRRPVQQEGIAAFYGLGLSKPLTSVHGGMVTTDDQSLARSLRDLRQQMISPPSAWDTLRQRAFLLAAWAGFNPNLYGLVNWLERRGELDRLASYYDEEAIDLPADALVAMASFQAAVGLAQLRRQEELLARRREVARIYDRQLEGVPGLRLPPLVEGAAYSHYVPRHDRREQIIELGLRRGVQMGRVLEYAIPELSAYRARPGAVNPCPEAAALARTVLNLPLWIEPKQALWVARMLREVVNEIC